MYTENFHSFLTCLVNLPKKIVKFMKSYEIERWKLNLFVFQFFSCFLMKIKNCTKWKYIHIWGKYNIISKFLVSRSILHLDITYFICFVLSLKWLYFMLISIWDILNWNVYYNWIVIYRNKVLFILRIIFKLSRPYFVFVIWKK